MARKSIMTDAVLQKVNEMYSNSISSPQIAKQLYVSASTVVSCIAELKKSGAAIQKGYFLKVRRKHNTLTIADIQEINRLYDNGATEVSIAKKYDLHFATVSKFIWNSRYKQRASKK